MRLVVAPMETMRISPRLKKELVSFRQDIESLLPNMLLHSFNNDFIMVMEQIINLLPGLPWQGKRSSNTL
jgi:hypothetical protein